MCCVPCPRVGAIEEGEWRGGEEGREREGEKKMNMKMPGFSVGKTEKCLEYGLVEHRAWRYKLVYNHKPCDQQPQWTQI